LWIRPVLTSSFTVFANPLFPVAELFGNLGDVIGEMDRAFVIPVGKNTRETALHYKENNKKYQRKLDNKFAGNSIQFRSG
jgi:hypothetical protein